MTTDQRSEDDRLKRLRVLASSSVVGADLKWVLDEYDRLNRSLEEADRRYRARHSDLMYADVLYALAGDLEST
jgi:hypothetical protein